jgi:hypothetical protein
VPSTDRFDLAAGGPLAVTIVVVAALLMNPGIQQYIPRAAVETGYRLAGFDQAEVAEAANVQYGAIAGLLFKQGFMERLEPAGRLARRRRRRGCGSR